MQSWSSDGMNADTRIVGSADAIRTYCETVLALKVFRGEEGCHS